MGMYTEIDLRVKLSLELRPDIIKWIEIQTNKKYLELEADKWHELMKEYTPKEFKGTRVDTLRWWDDYILRFRKLKDCYFLRANFEIKNYDDELELLVNTLKPYIIQDGVIGKMKYEEYEFFDDIIKNGNEIEFNYGHNDEESYPYY